MEVLVGLVFALLLGLLGVLLLYSLGGIIIVQPFTQVVVLRFGKFKYTIDHDGLNYVFPLGRRLYRLSSQVVTVNLPRTIVVEASGNPIEVSAICGYRIREAHRAVLEVENCQQFVVALATVVLKHICSHYPYESHDPQQPCLKKESEVVREHLMRELARLLTPTGVEVLDFRLNDLAYTPEIAQSMLLRQQAVAMVDARRTLVEGAVSTVQGALMQMSQLGLAMPVAAAEDFAAKLMLVLCSGERVQTVMPIEVREAGMTTQTGAGPQTGAWS
jgi:regulator of protease activity HflC (stomatin/prohibitin superfamily)